MTGVKIKDMGYAPGLQPESPYWAIKKPVFSFEKIRGAEISLGPENEVNRRVPWYIQEL